MGISNAVVLNSGVRLQPHQSLRDFLSKSLTFVLLGMFIYFFQRLDNVTNHEALNLILIMVFGSIFGLGFMYFLPWAIGKFSNASNRYIDQGDS